MKSKRAEQVLDVASFTDEFDYRYVHFENACEAVELAERDAEEEIEALKARAVEAFKEYMEQAHGGYLTSDLDNFIQKLNEL